MSVEQIISAAAAKLVGVSGVTGVVLGGSRARGNHRPNSDIDIGIYYDQSDGLDLEHMGRIAAEMDDQHRQGIITGLGEWGPWVNGGGWLIVRGYHVDFLLRDINRVVRVIDQCLAGDVQPHYQVGHPHAYINVMYMGEIAVCRILADPSGRVAELKVKTTPYPPVLRKAIIDRFLFEASFSLMLAEGTVDKDDLSYVVGCIFRAISCLNQVLFALNREYCLNEKKAVPMIESFALKPSDYKERVEQAYSLLSPEKDQATMGLALVRTLIAETEQLLQD